MRYVLESLLNELLAGLPARLRRPHLLIPIRIPEPRIIFQGGTKMAITITATQKFTAGPVSAVDAHGNPAQIDGAPAWSVSDTALLAVNVAADGLSADIQAVGALGHAQVVVSADADLGEGIETISGILEVEIVAGRAVSLTVPAGEPTEQ
jgi:hypothetical protein